jgi:hypothetical protein
MASPNVAVSNRNVQGVSIGNFREPPFGDPTEIFFIRMPSKNQGLRKILQKAAPAC